MKGNALGFGDYLRRHAFLWLAGATPRVRRGQCRGERPGLRRWTNGACCRSGKNRCWGACKTKCGAFRHQLRSSRIRVGAGYQYPLAADGGGALGQTCLVGFSCPLLRARAHLPLLPFPRRAFALVAKPGGGAPPSSVFGGHARRSKAPFGYPRFLRFSRRRMPGQKPGAHLAAGTGEAKRTSFRLRIFRQCLLASDGAFPCGHLGGCGGKKIPSRARGAFAPGKKQAPHPASSPALGALSLVHPFSQGV